MEYTKGGLVASHTMDNSTTILCHDKKDVLCVIRWSGRAISEEEQKANAGLFAVASDMYEALKEAHSLITKIIPNDLISEPVKHAMQKQIVKVLAKAVGK